MNKGKELLCRLGVAAVSILLLFTGSGLPAVGARHIQADTLWTAAGSPYLISEDLIVDPGVTLTVEAGATVKFAKINNEENYSNRAEMIVKGTLKAVGTDSLPIRFTSATTSVEMGSWGGIFLEGNGSWLEYVQVDHAINGLTVKNFAQIRSSLVEDNLETGLIVLGNGVPVVEKSEFAYNQTGVDLRGRAQMEENGFLSNSYGLIMRGIGNNTVEKGSFESNVYGIYLEGCDQGNLVQENLISGNHYGIFVDGGVPPRANFNDLYNNRMYNYYLQAGADADARFNWWGTTNPDEIANYIFDHYDSSGPEPCGYVNYGDFLNLSALAPTILSTMVSPAVLRSGDITVALTFSKDMATTVKPVVTYGLVEPFEQYTADSGRGKWVNLTKYQFSITVPDTLAEGQYHFKITGAESEDGQKLKANVTYTFIIDRTPPAVLADAAEYGFSPNADGKKDSLAATFDFDEPASVTYAIYQGQNLVYGPIPDLSYVEEKVINWNGKNNAGANMPEGEYRLRLDVKDRAGNQNNQPYNYKVFIDLTAPLLEVNTPVGIQTEDLAVTGKIQDLTKTVTAFAYRVKNAQGWTPLGQVQGNLDGTLYTWALAGVADGVYELQASAVDQAGNQTVKTVLVETDTNAPEVSISSPAAGAHVAGEATVQAQVADYHLSDWRLEMQVDGAWSELVTGNGAVNGEIYQLVTAGYKDGDYLLRLTARDTTGKSTVKTQLLNIDNNTPPVLTALSVTPESISPNEDGVNEQVHFQGSFSELVTWQIQLRNAAGQSVRTLEGTGQTLESYWDGKNANGAKLADGVYTYVLSYLDQVGHAGTEESGQVTVDTVPPLLQVQPLPAMTNQSSLTVAGEVQNVWRVQVNGQTVTVQNGKFSSTIDLLEGENQISVTAEDQAGNRTVQTFKVICDTVLPVIQVNSLRPVTNQSLVQVSGQIIDMAISNSTLQVINAQGSVTLPLVLDSQKRFSLSLNLSEGDNDLIFSATDGANNTNTVKLKVQFLPGIPDITLIEPANPYLATSLTHVVLKIQPGSQPLDPVSIVVKLDGVSQAYHWDDKQKLATLDLAGLIEGEHLLTADANNIKGEPGGTLQAKLVVDLTDPTLQVTTPEAGAILDGGDGAEQVLGHAQDQYLDTLTVSVKLPKGAAQLLGSADLREETDVNGKLAEYAVTALANGKYTMEITVKDLAGRQRTVSTNVEVQNTGTLNGKVTGALAKIAAPELLLVKEAKVADKIPFDPETGTFSKRVAVGTYDLVLAPWGYTPVMVRNLSIKTGQVVNGLQIAFPGDVQFGLTNGKQLIAVPFNITQEPQGVAGKAMTMNGWDGNGYFDLKNWTLFKPGRGYWVTSGEAYNLALENETAVTGEYRLPLKAGWNLLATPYNYPYPLEGLRFTLSGQSYTLAAGKTAGKIDGGIWSYDGWYREAGKLMPWKGYWLYVKEAGEAIFDPANAEVPYSAQGASLLAADRIQAPEWQMQIKAALADVQDVENYLGTAKIATPGLDNGLDLREPPGYNPYISLYFLEQGGEKLTKSFQAPIKNSQDDRQWQMAVQSSVTGWIKLSWDLEPDAILEIQLEDKTTGAKVDLFAQSSYDFFSKAGEVHQFVLTVHKGTFEIKTLYNYPNPFAALSSNGATGTHIRYLMTNDAAVEITIFDGVGRLVKRLGAYEAGQVGGQEGWNEIMWDGKNGAGQPCANGVYLYKIKALFGKKYYEKVGRMAIINGR